MREVTITDRDREAARACNGHNDVCEAIAQAREEGRAEEREACALWHDDRAKHFARFNDEDAVRRHGIYATAIRARGEV